MNYIKNKKFIKIYFLSFVFIAVLIGTVYFLFKDSQEVKSQAAVGDTAVRGYAWIGADCMNPNEGGAVCDRDPVGGFLGYAISFSCDQTAIGGSNTCGGTNYGVVVDVNSGELKGQAWIGASCDDGLKINGIIVCSGAEYGIGWLDFNNDASGAPGAGGPAKFNVTTKKIEGWAPIVSKEPDASGVLKPKVITWVKFSDINYGVKIDSVGNIDANDHYAWSGWGAEGGFGWIDFKDVKFAPLNQKPNASNLSVGEDDYCSDKIKFIWQFNDPDDGMGLPVEYSQQAKYQVQVATDIGFINIVYNNRIVTFPPLSYGKTYYWRVKVIDGKGAVSDWAISQYTTLDKYPHFDAPSGPLDAAGNPISDPPEVGVEYKFKTNNLSGGTAPLTWTWDFGGATQSINGDPSKTDGIITDQGLQTVTVVFDYPKGGRIIEAKICDVHSHCCKKSSSTNLKPKPPSWCEEGACP